MTDDELRKALEEHYSGDIVDILSESLEHTIEERNTLIDMYNALKAENAKLREERDKWKRDYEWLRARMDDVAESYKRIQEHDGRLYELVLYMWDFSCVAPDEPHTSKEELDYSVEVWKRMRELGIEV